MKFKKIFLIFTLFILLIFCVGVASALSDEAQYNVTSQIDELAMPDENSLLNAQENEDVVKSSGYEPNLSASKSQKTDLKIKNYTNFVKKDNKYYMYLTDSNGNRISDKTLSIKINGKTYEKTTNANGKFGIKIGLSKSFVLMDVSFKGDDRYNAFTQKFGLYIEKSITMKIGNSKLLTNGYLRVYLSGPTESIANKAVKIIIGNKTFTKKTNEEGFIIFKPKVDAKKYDVLIRYGNYTVLKKVKCIEGNMKNPLKQTIPLVNGVPDIDVMPKNFVMGDNDAKYSLKKAQYREIIKRDSYCLYLYNKLSNYTFFKTKASPNVYHILKREKWNVIERAINIKLVKKNQYNYWPSSITVSLKGKSYTYSEVRDIQNTGYTCGPTSASVCSQVLKRYNSEKFFQLEANVVNGVNIPVLKKAMEKNNYKTYYFYTSTINNAVKEVAKGGAALIAFLPGHYVAIIDVSPDGKKVLVSNSYGSYDVGSGKVPTNWVSLKYFKTRFADIGLVVKLNYKLSKAEKKEISKFYKNMGENYHRQNVNERIPNIPL